MKKINKKALFVLGISLVFMGITSYFSLIKENGSFFPLLFIPALLWGFYYGSLSGALSGTFFSIYTLIFIFFVLNRKNTVPYILVAAIMLISVGFIVGKLSELYKKTRSQELKIDRALKDKKLLLRELHHRVKNNLNIMANFVYLQAESVSGDEAKKVLQETHSRILSMLDIYNELYRSEEYARINSGAFLQNITRNYEIPGLHIVAEVEEIELDSGTAVYLGLIANELITNAIKYAFPEGGAGRIFLGFKKVDEGEIELTVSDDGVGIPEDFSLEKAGSFGFILITNLAAQLECVLTVTEANGTRVVLRCPLKESESFENGSS